MTHHTKIAIMFYHPVHEHGFVHGRMTTIDLDHVGLAEKQHCNVPGKGGSPSKQDHSRSFTTCMMHYIFPHCSGDAKFIIQSIYDTEGSTTKNCPSHTIHQN